MIQMPGIRVNENLHIVLWLVKDLAWLMEYRITGLVMVPPTIAMAFFIAWQCRTDRRELVHAIAVILWILANSTWMLCDFFYDARGHGIVQALFIAGLVLLEGYYLVMLPLELRRRRDMGATKA
ncbi:MAG: hypothetical protein KF797_01145 [Flavobacteriales bacterium]|nr:hypothetical protein [Flavobacteriales bacterium]